jgi:hypothetical protein
MGFASSMQRNELFQLVKPQPHQIPNAIHSRKIHLEPGSKI